MLKNVFSAALCCLPLGLLAQPLANPGFEQGAAGWNLPQPICQIAPGEGRNGTAALVWENTDASLPLPRPRATQELKLQANQTYRISCFVKGRIDQLDRFNIGASFYLQIMNGNDVINYLYVRGLTQSSEEWQYVSKDFTFPPNADRCIVSAGIHHLGTGKAFFDDFNLENLNEYFIYMTSPGMGTVFQDAPTVRAAVYYTGPELPAGLQARLTVADQAVLATIADGQAVFQLPELPVGSTSARLELLATDGATVLASETHLLSIRPPPNTAAKSPMPAGLTVGAEPSLTASRSCLWAFSSAPAQKTTSTLSLTAPSTAWPRIRRSICTTAPSQPTRNRPSLPSVR